MAVLADLTIEERYLLAILQDQSGIDQAEFLWTDETSKDFCFRCWDFQYCLGGETRMVTTKGVVPIRDAVGKVELLTEGGGEGQRGKWVAAEVRSFGVAPLSVVHLERRGLRKEVRATANHRWFAGDGRADRRTYREVETRGLQPGMWLKPVSAPHAPFSLNREAVQRGVVWGDGTHIRHNGVPGSSRVKLWGDKRSLVEWFDMDGRPVGDENVSVPGLYLSPLPVDWKLNPVGIEEPLSHLWGWLAGYFATDGSVAKDGTCVITSVDKSSVEHVRDVATVLGIDVSIRSGGIAALSGNQVFIATLKASDLPDGFFLLEKHRQRRRSGVSETSAWRVVGVDHDVAVEEVFCAVVPGTHSFALEDSLLTGNSWYRSKAKFQIDQAGRAVGKALDVDTPIPTPGGWTTMGDLRCGDLVYGSDGKPVRVVAAYDVMHGRSCYEVVFDTGESIVADGDHLWTVRRLDLADRRQNVLTTREMASRGTSLSKGGSRFAVDVTQPLVGLSSLDVELPIPPWLLGYWLGDGTTRTGQITVGAQDIDEFLAKVAECGYTPKVRDPYPGRSAHLVSLMASDGTQFGRQLTAIGAKLPDRIGERGAKRIPSMYLLAGVEARLALLRGFMDADGTATSGRASFDLMDERLAEQVVELVRSLGERVFSRKGPATLAGRTVGQRIRVGWKPRNFVPFGYKRKSDLIDMGHRNRRHMSSVRAIQPVATRPVRCISVDSDDRLFLAGVNMIPTHNSNGIQMRAFSFPFTNPGEEMLLTAPELIHLDPITKAVENRIVTTRITREFLKKSGTGNGIRHRPFEARFRNGSRIVGRIPQKDGKGVKGSVAGSTYISTMRGLIPASEVVVGDMVLTHEARYRPVLAVNTGVSQLIRVVGPALRSGVVVSENHRFYGRLRSEAGLGRPTWIIAGIEDQEWSWASPVDHPPLEIPVPGFPIGASASFSWLCGYYWGAGTVSVAGSKILLSLGSPKSVKRRARRVDAIKLSAALVGFDRVEEEGGKVAVYSSELADFCDEHLSSDLPLWVYGMAQQSRDAFFDGLLAARSFVLKVGNFGFDFSGKWDALEVKMLAQSVGYNARISQGGTRRDRWRLRVFRPKVTRVPSDGVRVWSQVKGFVSEGFGPTFDFVVADDASYVGDGVIHKGSTL